MESGPGVELPQEWTLDVNPEALSAIEDNTLGVRRAEVEAYHLMLDQIRHVPEEVTDAQSRDDVAFTVIMLQSEDYRGQVIGIRGQLRRLTEHPVIENDRGIDRLYEGWVFTNDSGDNPWRFLCTQLPPEAEVGENISPVKARVAGYFFKRTGYLSQGGQHVAPTLLAKSFQIVPVRTKAVAEIPSGLEYGLLIGVGVLTAALMLIWGLWIRSDRAFVQGRLGELAASRLDADRDDLEALKQWETVDPSRLFEGDSTSEGGSDPHASSG